MSCMKSLNLYECGGYTVYKMFDFTVYGAIFDVDDTLLDNEPGLAEDSLHARSRLAAIREAG